MKKTLLLSLVSCLLSLAPCLARAQFREDIVIQREISPEYARIVVAEAVSRNENKSLSTISAEMADKLLSTLKPQYIKNIRIDKDEIQNTLYLSGSLTGEKNLKYQISRNLVNTFAAYNVIKGKMEQKLAFDSIQDLNGLNMDLSKMNVEKFNNEKFLTYNDENTTYIEGNIGNQLNVQISATGENHNKTARDFLRSLSFDKMEQAVSAGEYQKTLADIEKIVDEKTKDPRYVKKLFKGK